METGDGLVLAALVYPHGGSAVIGRLVEAAQGCGLVVAGMTQKDEPRVGRTSCDMTLIDVVSGREIIISEQRGEGARGCHLDTGALEEASALMLAELDAEPAPDVMILSKFGKQEIAGRGFRQVVEKALDRGVPVLVGVGEENLPGFRDFGGGLEMVVETVAEGEAIVARIAAVKV